MASTHDKQGAELVALDEIRDRLVGSGRTYYVDDALGDDANDGLSVGAGAFKTITKAVNTVADTLDLNGFTSTINVADGTYTESVRLKQCVGATSTSFVSLTGNPTTPGNVEVTGGISVSNSDTNWKVNGFYTTFIRAFRATQAQNVEVANIEWDGNTSGGLIVAEQNSYVEVGTGTITHTGVSGGGPVLHATESSTIARVNSPVIDFPNAVAIAGVVRADRKSHVALQGLTFTNGGNVSGTRFLLSGGSAITTASNDLHYIPGTGNGVIDSGSSYDGYTQFTLTSGTPTLPTNPQIGIYQFDSTNDLLYIYDGTIWLVFSPDNGREVLTAHRTYYVRTDGDDGNDGLTDTALGAFLTIQKGLDVIGFDIDCAGYEVTLQVRDGTYAEIPEVRELVGGDSDGSDPNLYVRGNTTTPGNVVVNGFEIEGVGSTTRVELEGFQVGTTSRLLEFTDAKYVQVGNMDFSNASASAGFWLVRSCVYSKVGATWTFNSDIGQLLYVQDQSKMICDNAVTIDAAVAITPSATVRCIERSYMDLNAVTWANSGNVTGQRFVIQEFSEIFTGNAAPLTFIPGTTTGSQDDTSRIDDYFKFGATVGAPATAGASAGQAQYDSSADILYIFDGTTWQTH